MRGLRCISTHRLATILPVAVLKGGDEASKAAGCCPHQPLVHPHLCLSKLLCLMHFTNNSYLRRMDVLKACHATGYAGTAAAQACQEVLARAHLLNNHRPWFTRLLVINEVCSIHSPKAARRQFLSQTDVFLQAQECPLVGLFVCHHSVKCSLSV